MLRQPPNLHVSLSLFLLVLFKRVVVIVEIVFHPRQLEWLYSYDLILGAAFRASNDIAFFHFIQFNI